MLGGREPKMLWLSNNTWVFIPGAALTGGWFIYVVLGWIEVTFTSDSD
jgi:hypothetical protein